MKISKIIIVFSAVVLGAGLGWYLIKKDQAKKNGQICTTEAPNKRDLMRFVTASGNLKALEQITVGSLVAGKVVQLLADDNDLVKENQMLAILDNGQGDSSVKMVKAQLAQAEKQLEFDNQFYKRQTALYKSGQLAKNLFEQYGQNNDVNKEKVKELKARLEIEEKTYENLFIRSPANGVVISKQVDLGQMVTSQLAATVLFEIAKDLHKMEAWLDVDEADIGSVAVDQEAYFSVDAFPDQKFVAKVKRVRYQSKNVDNVITYATVLDVENPELKLRPGMTTNVEIKVAEAKDALCISNRSLRVGKAQIEELSKKNGLTVAFLPDSSLQDKSPLKKLRDFVWVLDRGSKTVRQVRIALGVSDGKYTQVLNGLTPSEMVITDVEVERENMVMKMFPGQQGGIGK